MQTRIIRRVPAAPRRSLLSGLLSGLAALILSGCAALAPAPDTAATDEITSAVSRPYHEAIDLGGRLSVRYQQGEEQSVHGSFVWSQDRERTAVTLLSPLGQTMAIIEVTPGGATLTKAGQPVQTATDVDSLTASALGWPLPVSRMRDWLQGFVMTADNQAVVAAPGNADSHFTTSDGWRIHYADWQTDVQPARPRRIDLERNTEQAGLVAMRIVLDSWQPRESLVQFGQ